MVHFNNKGKTTSDFHRITVSADMPGFVGWKGHSQTVLYAICCSVFFLCLAGRDVFISEGRRLEVLRGDKEHVSEKSTKLRV